MKNQFRNLENKKIVNINYYSFNEACAKYFCNILIQVHSINHLYIIKENMRYYIRGIVAYDDFDMNFERFQIALLAYYCDCVKYNVDGSNNVGDADNADDNIF